ncbi:MAG: AsmA family protein [Candidatus Omnitrophica bacterium]|nr:AsmA family protein [Candidatus Omnitrophota bacterium]
MNRALKIVIIVVVVLVALALLRDQLVKAAVVMAARQIAGVEVTIDHFSMSFIRQSVNMKGIKVYNPQGFVREVMVDIPELNLDCDVGAFLKGNYHVRYLRLDLKQVLVERDLQGKTNVNSLPFAQASSTKTESRTASAQLVKEPAKPADIKMQIDLASLNLGRVLIKELRSQGEPSIRTIELNVKDKEFKNITSAGQLAALVMMESLSSIPTKFGHIKIKGLSSNVVGSLLEGLSGVLK